MPITFCIRRFLILPLTLCVNLASAEMPQATIEGHVGFSGVPVYVEFRNSPLLTARIREHLAARGITVIEKPDSVAPRLSVYGYHSSRDKLGRLGVVDLGRLYEGMATGADGAVDATHTHHASLPAAQEAGKLAGGVAQGAGISFLAAVAANILEAPDEGMGDAYIRRRFLAQAGVNAAQVWAVLTPAGAAPYFPGVPGEGVVRVTVRYEDKPADPVSVAIEMLLPALAVGGAR